MSAPFSSGFFDHLPAGIYRTTPDGHIVAANRTMVEMLGYATFEELSSVDLQRGAAHASYSREKFRNLLDRFGELRGIDAIWTRADGTTVQMRESVRAVRGEEGEVAFYEGIVEQLPSAEQSGAPRIDSSDAILCVDAAGRVVTINAPLVALCNLGHVPATLDEVFDIIASTLTLRSAAELEAFRHDPDARKAVLLHDQHGRALSVMSWQQRVMFGTAGRAFSFRDVTGPEGIAPRPQPFIDLLSRAAQMMLSGRDANQYLCRVLDAAAEATDAPFGLALFVTATPHVFRVACMRGANVCDAQPGDSIETGEELAQIAQRGVPAIVDAALLGVAARAAAPRICVAPLVVDGATSGFLCLGIDDLDAFRSDDLATLAAFATIAAIAIDRWEKFDHLAASEAKYRALTEIGGTIVYDLRVQADGTIEPRWRSEQILALTGFDTTTLRSFFEFANLIHPDDRHGLHERWERLRRGETDTREWRVNVGNVRWVEDSVRALDHRPDGSMRIVGGARDITSLKGAEISLRESEEYLRLVVEAASDPMVMTDHERTIVFANGAVQRVFGYAPGELTNRPLHVLIREEGKDRKEVTGVTRDGREIPLDVSAGHAATPRGVRTTWILRDASRRKAEAQEQETLTRVLRTVAREWVATFDAVDSPMFILEPNLTIRRLNRAARELVGATYADLVGRRVDEIATGEPWLAAAAMCRAAAESNAPQTLQLRDEQTKTSWDVSVTAGSATVFPHKDRFLILNLRDVSRVADLQEANRRSELLAALGSVVGGVAHEVRNPLFAISATLEAFEKEMEGRDEFAEYVAVFKGELDRLTKLMQDLLEFGKPSAREHQHGSLVETIFAARQQCIGEMQSRGVRVEIEAKAEPLLAMDDQRMTQLFQNLIENAVQHSPAGSTVDVRVYSEPELPFVQCQIIDRGAGFAPADLARAFEPFFSRRNGGTGLGLSLVQRIVEEHRGSISIANAVSGGAIVDIVFPAVER